MAGFSGRSSGLTMWPCSSPSAGGRGDRGVSYGYAGIEPQSWKALREECGFIHDVAVNESGRRMGVATALVEAAIAWLRERRMPRVVLGTAERNEAAQRLFSGLGF